MAYSIKEIADMAGVTIRTIRYYDEIGLLSPAETGDNGYRYYDRESLLHLQQILFLRELDMPLKEIGQMINRPGFSIVEALESHRLHLNKKVRRLNTLVTTIDDTIEALKGAKKMKEQAFFKGFDASQYEDEVRERWGDSPKYFQSRKKWDSYSKDQKEAIKEEGRRITARMAGTDANTLPDDPEVQEAVSAYHAYINKYFYTCDIDSLRGLANMWVEDPRFAANYEEVREGGAKFVREAVRIYCDNNS